MGTKICRYGYQNMSIWEPKYVDMGTKICRYGYQNMSIWEPKYDDMGTKICRYGNQKVHLKTMNSKMLVIKIG